jgi:MscS family membrane protein
VSLGSPRASLQNFLELTRAGAYAAASLYLDAPTASPDSAATLARDLKAVLDRYLWFDLDDVSPLASGDTTDGLSEGVDHLGSIPIAGGPNQPVRLIKTVADGETRWRFTRATVERIPGWYSSLGDRWIIEHLPSSLRRPGPFEILWWQWLALPILVSISAFAGALTSRLAGSILRRATQRTTSTWDDAIVDRLSAPLTLACALAVLGALLPFLGLYQPAADAGYRLVRAGFLVVVFWSLWRLVDVGRLVMSRSEWARNAAGSRSLLPLGARTAKVVILAIAGVSVFSLLGYPVASLIAGLGLGGLALALAAQKTVENVFGAFSIGIDQPFREGDFVKIEDFVATVEAIGLRSTRFRTLDRTLVTIPNGRLADMRLESFTARDRLRLAAAIGLVYETTGVQMRQVLAGFERVLRDHPKIWPDAVVVRFREFGSSSLDIEVMAWFQTADWGEFQAIRQEILLRFMDVVEQAGTSFAFPTQTLHIASQSAPPRPSLTYDDDRAHSRAS